MKQSKMMMMVWGMVLGAVGGTFVIMNPNQSDYESYASDALSTYLKEEVCTKASQGIGGFLTSYCKTIVDTGRPQIRQIVGQRTQRANYLLFSIYETQISLPAPVPSYQFGTIGVLQNFYTYQAEEL